MARRMPNDLRGSKPLRARKCQREASAFRETYSDFAYGGAGRVGATATAGTMRAPEEAFVTD